ncbi:MAG: hypothetical protein IPL55_07670 [Saprospiraceae bacterium]|nr:hypothetical protein [Saprospiraceae bacterium]
MPCTNSRYPVTIRITDNCNCETINLLNIPSVCTSTGNLDLKTFSDTKPGTWTSNNSMLVINNGVLTLTGVPAGIYQLRYTLSNPVTGCPTFATGSISIVNPKDIRDGIARSVLYRRTGKCDSAAGLYRRGR